jgi:hypothetical protein
VIEGCGPAAKAYQQCVKGEFPLFPNESVCDRLRKAKIDGGCGGAAEDTECSGDKQLDATCFLEAVTDVCAATPEELDVYTRCVDR